MEEYNKMFKIGDRLILELKGKQIYEGMYADGGRDRITLTEVIQHNNKNKLMDLYDFHRNEIDRIHTLKASRSKEDPNEVTNLEKTKVEDDVTKIKLDQSDYYSLKEMAQNYLFLENVDRRYYDAVEILSNSETIGVSAYGLDKTRYGSVIKLLAMSTWKQVYIFDLSNVENKKLYPELKGILENAYICKVIHKSAGLVDILNSTYSVYTRNVFDTQVVDLMFQKTEKPKKSLEERDLSECLVKYLNFPKNFLTDAVNVTTKQWNERPLKDKRKLYASQLVTYLIVLKEHFQRILLAHVYDTIEAVQNHVDNLSDYDFGNYVSSNANKTDKKEVSKDLQSLIPSLKNLGLNENEQNNSE